MPSIESSDQECVFSPPGRVLLPVANSKRVFPVRRIYCVGRNFAAHTREMGGDTREPPFFFQKPTDAVVMSGSRIPYPRRTADFQHEIELVLAIARGGADIAPAGASSRVFGLCVGIDLTRRDLQVRARESGRPWELGKAFDQSAPLSAVHPLSNEALPKSGRISLSVNGVLKQNGDLSEMIWSCEEIVAQLSTLFELRPGDLIFTGTPAGVGKLVPGDRVEGFVEGVDMIAITIE
jgi:fumarylpyruvate hydrolase